MRKLLILVLILNYSFLSSQTKGERETFKTEYDSIIHKKIYRIEYSSLHTIELIEFKEGNYKGCLVNSLIRYGRKISKKFIQKITIPELLTEQLMNEFEELNIEKLEGCGNLFSPEYNCVGALDGDGTKITILTSAINKNLNFEAIYPGRTRTESFPEKQKKAQKILNLINEKFNLKEYLHKYMKNLPSGTYGYYGVNMIRIK